MTIELTKDEAELAVDTLGDRVDVLIDLISDGADDAITEGWVDERERLERLIGRIAEAYDIKVMMRLQ